MNIFVRILVVSSVALTKADISLNSGYTFNSNTNVPNIYYQQQHQHQQISNQQSQYSTQNIIPHSFLKPNSQYLPQLQPVLPQQHNTRYVDMNKQHQQHQFPMPADFPSMFSFQPAVKPPRRYRPRARVPKTAIVTKSFYTHSAPEETQAEIDEELAALQQQPRKHYNVLFVKTPSQTNKAAAVNLARALKEEKTVVYVLAKKTSAADLQDAVQESPQLTSKPEVFFIKYRTPEEAANAQRQIQSQYDSLGGSTTISDEGVAPVTSVIGSLDAFDDDDDAAADAAADEHADQPQRLSQQIESAQEQAKTTGHFDDQQFVSSLPISASHVYLPPPNQY